MQNAGFRVLIRENDSSRIKDILNQEKKQVLSWNHMQDALTKRTVRQKMIM